MAIYPRATNPIIDVEKKLKKNAKKIDMENSKDLINTETPCFTFINGPMNDISSTRIRFSYLVSITSQSSKGQKFTYAPK